MQPRTSAREMLLDQPILQGVIGQDDQSATGFQSDPLQPSTPALQLPNSELVVDGNAQRLEYARQCLVEHLGAQWPLRPAAKPAVVVKGREPLLSIDRSAATRRAARSSP